MPKKSLKPTERGLGFLFFSKKNRGGNIGRFSGNMLKTLLAYSSLLGPKSFSSQKSSSQNSSGC